ncbi:MAG: hypothetical protein Q9182_006801 [Xanthomendoza sp. 2 TL-2023]
MAITFADGVILGADSRTTTGAYIANRVTDKLTRVSDTIWCCRSGSAADTQAVADIVSYHLGMYTTMEGQQPSENMSEADGMGFVKGALSEAIKWDGSSGGVIRMVVLTGKGAKRLLFLPDQGYEGPGEM